MSAAEYPVTYDAKELCDRLADVTARAATMTGTEGAALALWQGGALVTVASHGSNAPGVGAAVPPASFAGQCFDKASIMVCDSVTEDPRVDAETCRALNIGSMLATPVIVEGKAQGVLAVFARQPGAFSRSRIDLVNTLAIVAGELLSPQPGPGQQDKAASSSEEDGSAAGKEVDSESQKGAGAQLKIVKKAGSDERDPGAVPHFCVAVPTPGKRSRLLTGCIVLALAAAAAVGVLFVRGRTAKTHATSPSVAATVSNSESAASPAVPAIPVAPEPVRASAPPRAKTSSPANTAAQTASSTVHPQPIVIRPGSARSNAASAEVAPPVLQLAAGAAPISFSAKPYLPSAPVSAVTPAVLVRKAAPVYPRGISLAGTVSLRATIQKDGRLGNITATGGPLLLREAAVTALKQWLYKPAIMNGQQVESSVDIKVNFAGRQ